MLEAVHRGQGLCITPFTECSTTLLACVWFIPLKAFQNASYRKGTTGVNNSQLLGL